MPIIESAQRGHNARIYRLTETRKPSLVLGVQRDQFQQRPGSAGLDDVVVVGARLGEDFVPALDALPAYSDQHGAFAGPVLANLSGSIPSISIRHRYVHDDYVGIEVPNVRNDGARAVDALGVVPMALKQVQQGIVRVLIVVHNENTGAVRHGEKNTGMGGAPHASLDLMRPISGAVVERMSGGKREADRDMTSPDGSADPGALSTRARLSGSPSERRHTSPGCLLRQTVPTPEREVQFSGRVSVSLFLRRVPILCLKYVLVPTVRRWMTTMTAGYASWTSVLPSKGNVEAAIYVGCPSSARASRVRRPRFRACG